ncbi:MAG: carboxypeptidase regulatory-like domain-containing protein [Oscillochloris sp.]|nr:carboxypeptidase regulatory-like domain-containing protein [Oscillochloris sp.]
MRWTSLIVAGLLVAVFAGAGAFGAGARAAGPILENEPNDTCLEAQDLGALAGQVTVQGNLEGLGDGAYPYPAPGMAPNLDFFQIATTPGSVIEIRIGGLASGLGTLEDPFLGVFSGASDGCAQLETIDYGGPGGDVRFQYAVNSDSLVLAVTSCCDYSFVNGGFGAGSYSLEIEELQPAQALFGSVIDADTGVAPLPDQYGFAALVELYRCSGGECSSVASNAIDTQGRFSFIHTDAYPVPGSTSPPPQSDNPTYLRLFAGEYQVRVFSPFYEPYASAVVTLEPAGLVDLGVLAITPIPLGTSITGRVVDAISGEPLSGLNPPYANVFLNRCDEFGCANFAGTAFVGDDGVFVFTRESVYDGLRVGTYVLNIYAEGYQFGLSEPFEVTEDAEIQLGDVALVPNPIRFSAWQGCPNIPSRGGDCAYQLDVTSGKRQTTTFEVWSVVNTYNFSTSIGSAFQPEAAERLRLRPGQTKTVEYELRVPRAVSNGTSFCATVYVAEQGRGFYFQPIAQTSVFCAVKEDFGFRLLSDDEARTMMQRIHGVRESGLTRR